MKTAIFVLEVDEDLNARLKTLNRDTGEYSEWTPKRYYAHLVTPMGGSVRFSGPNTAMVSGEEEPNERE